MSPLDSNNQGLCYKWFVPLFHVATGRERYPVLVDRGALAQWREHLPSGCGQVFVVTEENIWRMHGARFEHAPAKVYFLPGGEETKRLATLEAAADWMLSCGADRTSVVVAFGGGIVNDMAGFLAAVFMRGIPVIQAPTTLLAQVDASVGGKTGVNLAGGKNLIGSFHQPLAVLIDPSLLETLPEREYKAGLFEVIKAGVIASPELFDTLAQCRDAIFKRSAALIDSIIAESVRIKAEIVSADERESGLRRLLNFGHTIGHAIEAETGYTRFLHGETVALGMKGAVALAYSSGNLNASDADAITRLIHDYGPIPAADGVSAVNIFQRLRSDKKTVHGRLHFVLPTRIGHAKVFSDLSPELVREAIDASLA